MPNDWPEPILRPFGRYRRPFILAGHDIQSRNAFGQFLDALLNRGIRFVRLEELVSSVHETTKPSRVAALTFDDAHTSVRSQATPECEARGIPYTVFVIGERADGGCPPWFARLDALLKSVPIERLQACWPVLGLGIKCDARGLRSALKSLHIDDVKLGLQRAERELSIDVEATSGADYLDPSALRELATHPLVTIGSHTYSHPVLSNLSPSEQRAEIEKGHQAVARLGPCSPMLAIPDGWRTAFDSHTPMAVRDAGMLAAFTMIQRPLRAQDNPFLLPRIGISDPFAPIHLTIKRLLPFVSPRAVRNDLAVRRARREQLRSQ